jgi:predicted TIM-barrel fold metal-dependent hydrolase
MISSPSDRAHLSRRDFLAATGAAAIAAAVPRTFGQAPAPKQTSPGVDNRGAPTHPLIDMHAHQLPDSMRGRDPTAKDGKGGATGRTEAQFVAHQKAVNAVASVILGGNDYEFEFMKAEPNKYIRFASAQRAGGDRGAAVEAALKGGAKGIGEHRWEGDIPFTWRMLDMARDYKVPILFHFEETLFPAAVYSEFYKVIEKYPTVTFIGHGIDWWGAIDKNYHKSQGGRPRGLINPGGLTDQWLSRYPNLHCDMSAGSGNNALLRDPYRAKEFLIRHQDRLLFGSDCNCSAGGMPTCWTAIKIMALNYLELTPEVQQKLYISNAAKLFGFKVS